MTNIKQNRFLSIAKTKESIFQIDDLAKIWRITNRRNLVISVNRYVASGLLHRIQRGLYSIKPISELDPIELGLKLINDYAYLSTESVLAKQGIIFQNVNYHTFIGQKSKRFEIGSNKYYCRQLKEDYLFNDLGIIKHGRPFNEASPERALADMLYFNPRYHFDNLLGVNKEKLKNIQKKVYNK